MFLPVFVDDRGVDASPTRSPAWVSYEGGSGRAAERLADRVEEDVIGQPDRIAVGEFSSI